MRAIELEIWIGADRETVFDALTTRDGLNAWWGEALSAAEPGGVVAFDHGLGEPLRMRVVELVPGERIVWRCVTEYTDPGMPGTEWLGTRIAFDLVPVGDGPEHAWMRAKLGIGPEGTILRFRHDGWADEARWFGFCAEAWGVTLAGLAERCGALASA
jgi:uncharacterized protein YndB with AHSA1/START domain